MNIPGLGSSLVYVVAGVHKSSLHSNMSIPPLYKLPFLFDEAKCIEFLLEKAIINPAMRCQACGFTTRREKKRWICRKYSCRKAISIFSSSFFANTRLKCNEVLMICYF